MHTNDDVPIENHVDRAVLDRKNPSLMPPPLVLDTNPPCLFLFQRRALMSALELLSKWQIERKISRVIFTAAAAPFELLCKQLETAVVLP